jgi:hypothetical protein
VKAADLTEVIHTLHHYTPPEKLLQLLSEHEGVTGHCSRCRVIAPCTLWTAAMAARRAQMRPFAA